ncbi:MAG: c-type cytochrome [Cyclobacteriaceae bacterium]|jgi:mono/diheme cytochrome c family protein
MKYVVLIVVVLVSLSAFQTKPGFDLKSSVARGKEVYIAYCVSCHMESGEGVADVFPPVAKSDYLMADKKRSIQQVLYGITGEIKVNGKMYNTDMTGFDLSDQEVSDVLNYIRNSFGNKGGAVTPAEVKAARK